MMRICWLFLLPGLCLVQHAAAQGPPAGPKEKVSGEIVSVELQGDTLVYRSVPDRRGLLVAADGSRYRLRPVKGYTGPAHALSFEIGAYPACGMRDIIPGTRCYDANFYCFPGEFPGERRYYEGPLRTTGGLGVAYGYRVRRWLEVGASFTYAGYYCNLLRTSDGGVASRLREHYLTLMPYVRFSWLNRRSVRLYASLHAGYQLGIERDYKMDKADKNHYFGGQFTPFGISVGRRLFGYAEIGVGMRGVFVGGIGYRFGKDKK